VLHLGTPASMKNADDNHRAAASRSLDEIGQLAEPLGVRVAVEVIPNRLSDAAALVTILERELDGSRTGICLDFGHAHLMGDVADAVETVAEHIIATHVHDNHGREDEHLVPYRGSIDWDQALVTMQKIGYEGTYLMELAGTGGPASILEDARRARARFERTLAHA
jgi:sugar phosphate isomerase/epimerase